MGSAIKVGLIGYFNSGAYSDDLIECVTKKLLYDINPDIEFDSTLLQRCAGGTDVNYLNGFDLIIHAGGSLLGKCTHFPVRDIAAWKDKVKTPLAIFGPGYRFEPDKEPLSPVRRCRLQTLFDRAEVISVRGYYTVKYLRANGVDVSKIDSIGDPVMACAPRPRRLPKYIMGNVRNMSTAEIQHTSTQRVQRLMAESYDWLIDHYEQPLKLISFRHNVPDDNDITGARAVKKLMTHDDQVDIVAYPTFSNSVDCMMDASFWFGQRLHPSVFAAVQGIPFVGVEYQFDKMLDWASTVEIDNFIRTDTTTLEDFIEAHIRVEDNMERLKRTIPRVVQNIRKTASKIMDLV